VTLADDARYCPSLSTAEPRASAACRLHGRGGSTRKRREQQRERKGGKRRGEREREREREREEEECACVRYVIFSKGSRGAACFFRSSSSLSSPLSPSLYSFSLFLFLLFAFSPSLSLPSPFLPSLPARCCYGNRPSAAEVPFRSPILRSCSFLSSFAVFISLSFGPARYRGEMRVTGRASERRRRRGAWRRRWCTYP